MTTIEELPAELGFVETELLKALHQMVVAAYLANGLKASSLMAGYQQVGEQLIAGIEGDQVALAQIGLIVQSGLIRREGLRLDRYRQDLQDAQSYADQAGFDDVHAAITQELDKLELSMRLPVESGVILAVVCADLDDESRIELLTMSDDEALGFCFTLLFAAGIEDPEAYLRERDILE